MKPGLLHPRVRRVSDQEFDEFPRKSVKPAEPGMCSQECTTRNMQLIGQECLARSVQLRVCNQDHTTSASKPEECSQESMECTAKNVESAEPGLLRMAPVRGVSSLATASECVSQSCAAKI